MRYTILPQEFFIRNRDKLIQKLPANSIALIFGSYQMPRNGDQYYPYRQNSDFFYLTGIEQEKSILLISTHENAKELQQILFILKPNKELETWEGHKLTAEEARDISGVKTIKFIDDFEIILHSLVFLCNKIYFNLRENPKFLPDVQTRDHDCSLKIQQKYPAHKIERLSPLIQACRITKTKEEIASIKKACTITRDAFFQVLKFIRPNYVEYAIEAEITREFIRQGASGHAYPPIIASGRNACVLHYIENDKICKNGDLLLMDFGAEYGNYAADLSRTIPVNGKYTPRQRQVYDANLRVFKYALALFKPGISIENLHKEVCKKWEEEHIGLGLYSKNDVEKNKTETQLWYNYYMHGTSHFLGMDVHDAGTRETLFEPGMVLTCEPGIYIPDEGIGIRIETNVLITKDGCIDLMEDIPVDADEIEQYMAHHKYGI